MNGISWKLLLKWIILWVPPFFGNLPNMVNIPLFTTGFSTIDMVNILSPLPETNIARFLLESHHFLGAMFVSGKVFTMAFSTIPKNGGFSTFHRRKNVWCSKEPKNAFAQKPASAVSSWGKHNGYRCRETPPQNGQFLSRKTKSCWVALF